ncbi:glycosyltransferase family protein [Sediminibacterium soli]|uniref:glycosyltransferase family 4 protein n=1 Tax=Sediminibacterium soli TaxID=2698829 RepID=UPI00137A22F2|nr:glycosyltransferase family 4 protein [Sediminibacterium soli]NCI48080.1 glycosyltransferase family 4 protein [Sediminibacterium soli]
MNKVFINGFKNKGFTVSVIARAGYLDELQISNEDIALKIPESYYVNNAGSIKDRLRQWLILRFIRKRISFRKYDVVFFSFFDEIVFSLSGIKGNLFFMNHSNVSGLENTLKCFFLRRIERMGTILVFHEMIRRRFADFGMNKVIVEPLGLSLPYYNDLERHKNLLEKVDPRLSTLDFRLTIFIPTVSKYRDHFLWELLSSKSFLDFLLENRVLFVIKDDSIDITHPNICQVKSFLNDETYQAIFMKSDFLVLQYPDSFKYKVSASLFECFSNNKPCFLSDIEAFRVFNSYFNYDPYYNSIEKLTELIQISIARKDLIVGNPYNNTALLNPTLETIVTNVN